MIAPKPTIEVIHYDRDHRIYTYHWDPETQQYVQQPGPGRPVIYPEDRPTITAEQARRDMTRALEEYHARSTPNS